MGGAKGVTDERQIKRAIRDLSCFYLVYQPQFYPDKSLRGFEALVRLKIKDDERYCLPQVFIPLIESMQLINQVGYLIFTKALLFFDRNDLFLKGKKLSINISPRQIEDDSFVIFVKKFLRNHNESKGLLYFEITESCSLMDLDKVRKNMDLLVACGAKFSIDDFGVGYSSFKYLEQLPFSEVKIDKSFAHCSKSVAVKNSLILECFKHISTTLSLDLVIEGVETQEDFDRLSGLNCVIQGFFFGRPLLENDALNLLLKMETENGR